jgi:ankyrin repeat protein
MLNQDKRCPRYVDEEGETCSDHKNCRMMSDAGYMSPRSSPSMPSPVSSPRRASPKRPSESAALKILNAFYPNWSTEPDLPVKSIDILNKFLRIDPNAVEDNFPVLHHLINKEFIEEVRILLRSGADPNVKNRYDQTPLLRAIDNENIDMVKLLVQYKARIEDENLCKTLFNDLSEIAIFLLENGANPNAICNDGVRDVFPAINFATKHGRIRIVEELLKKGADPNAKDSRENTPIIEASANGRLDIIKLLMKNGGNLKCSDMYGWTPLITAAQSGHVEIVRMLLDPRFIHNVDINSKDDNGHSALVMSENVKNRIEIAELLVSKGADVNSGANDGWTVINYAAMTGDIEMVKFLLDHDAIFNTAVTKGRYKGITAITLAMKYGYGEVVELLERYTDALKDEMSFIFPDIVIDEIYNVPIYVERDRMYRSRRIDGNDEDTEEEEGDDDEDNSDDEDNADAEE